MKELFIFPFGGNAREALIAAMAQNQVNPLWKIRGFIDDDESLLGSGCCGVAVLGGRERLRECPSAYVLAVPGRAENFRGRKAIIDSLHVSPDRFVTVIDPSARIATDAKIGSNTVLMANVFVSSSVVIGNHCIILPNTVIAHESIIGDYTIIGSNVTISGGCVIGRNCYIGSGTSIRENLNIEDGALLGLGSNVIHDVMRDATVAGNPARNLNRT